MGEKERERMERKKEEREGGREKESTTQIRKGVCGALLCS